MGPFLSDASLFAGGIYPEAYYKKVGAAAMAQHPVGTGPYKLDKWVKGQYVRLAKNPLYWDAAKYPMQHVVRLSAERQYQAAQAEAGELDVIGICRTTW